MTQDKPKVDPVTEAREAWERVTKALAEASKAYAERKAWTTSCS